MKSMFIINSKSSILLFITTLFFTWCTSDIFAQSVNISVFVNPPYSPYLSDYVGLNNKVVMNLSNTTANNQSVYLKATITSNNGFSATTAADYVLSQAIVLAPFEVKQITANNDLMEFLNAGNIEVDYGEYTAQSILQDGILPEGTYSLCIEVFDSNTNEKLNAQGSGCTNFNIAYLPAPQIISPNCDNAKILKIPNNAILFNWTPLVSYTRSFFASYDVYIVKLNEGDIPNDAVETAIATNGVNAIKISDIQASSLSYDIRYPELQVGNYAWAVKAKIPNNAFPITNDGLSNVCTFEYKTLVVNTMMMVQNAAGPSCSCKTTIPNDLPAANNIAVGANVKVGNFDMEVKTISGGNGVFSGTGYINMPIINSSFVKINVVFENININVDGANFILTSGQIKAKVSTSAASMLPTADPVNPNQLAMGPAQITSFEQYFTNNANQLITNIKNAANSIAYDLPIGMNEKILNVAITKMIWSADQSFFDAVAVLDVIDGNTKLGLTAKDVCIENDGFCGDATLFLNQDFNIPVIGFNLKGGNEATATSISFDKDGFKNLHIHAVYTFPSNTLEHKVTHAAATVSLISDTEKGWNDWVGTVEISPFVIHGFDEFSFGPDDANTKMYYDHSDVRNPPGIPSPYTSTDSNEAPIATNLPTWRGFYIPSIGLTLPPSLSNIDAKPIVIKAEKLIFDEGISGSVSVNNIMSISDGSLDGWYFSIDQFKIDFWKNTFKKSSLNGKLVLPVSKDQTTASNQLDYVCTLSNPANSSLEFNFVITPKDQVAFNVFWAKGNLTQGTNIQISKKGDGKFIASAALFGQLTVQSEIKDLPDIKIAEVKFQNLFFQSQEPYFTPGQVNANLFGLASPQHSVAGFVIDLDPKEGRGVSLHTGMAGSLELGINFKALLKLVADVDFVPKAEVEFALYGKMTMNGKRPAWDGFDATVKDIKFGAEAKIGPVGIDGTIGYYNDKAGSYGFIGALSMNIKDLVEVKAKAQFGFQKEGSSGYNYFFIDAMVDLKNNSIPIPPAFALYGFSGGVFLNMALQGSPKLDGNTITGSPTYVYNKNTPGAGQTLSGLTYVPSKGKFSLNAGVLFGLKSRNILDADGSLTIEIDANYGGVSEVFLNLNGRFIVDVEKSLAERANTCMGKAEVFMKMNFVEKSFIFHAGLELGVPTYKDKTFLGATANTDLYVGPTGWFIHIGRPWTNGGDANGNNISGGSPIDIHIMGIKFMGYFQCGTGTGEIYENGGTRGGITAIDPVPPIPNFILNILNYGKRDAENGRVNSESNLSVSSQYIDGGLAFGANFTTNFNVNFLIFYVKATFMAGFDLAFYKLKDAKCLLPDGSIVTKGVNNFYATGQAYLGAKVDVGVEIDVFFYTGKISIAEAGIAAYVKFGAPNPTFLTGELGGYFSVLGGIVSGSFAVKFFWGERCTDLAVPEAIPLIAEVTPNAAFDKNNYKAIVNASEEQEIFMQPSITFNYEVDKTFLIIVPSPADSDGNTYRQYRYYHILPKDVTIDLGGGPISHDNEYYKSPLTMSHFKAAIDGYTFVLKEPIMFDPLKNYYLNVFAKVKLFDLKGSSKNYNISTGGYKQDYELTGVNNQNRDQWAFAKDKNNVDDYVDERHVKFKTNCGIKALQNEWITQLEPFHKSQNNPIRRSEKFNEGKLKKASNIFEPTYNLYSKNNSNILYTYSLMLGNKNYLNISVDNSYLNLNRLCLPADFKNNSDIFLKVSTFDKSANGSTFETSFYKATIDNTAKIATAKLDKAFPKQSIVIVQLVIKKRASSTPSTDIGSKFVSVQSFKMDGKLTTINNRSVSLDKKLMSQNEMELYRWYFNTGEYDTYQDKFKALDITVDTVTMTSTNHIISKSGIKYYNFKSLVSTYDFFGTEKFDFHDLNDHDLNQVLSNNNGIYKFSKKLEDGMLGFAFDNKSQKMVDDFLNLHFENENVRKMYMMTTNNSKISDTQIENSMHLMMYNYITEKMLDATRWENVQQKTQVLPPMGDLPLSLKYGTQGFSLDISMFQKRPMHLFSIQRISRVFAYEGSTSKAFPSHIITMKNLMDNLPSHGGIEIQSYLSDMISDFNNNIFSGVANGFNPGFVNNKFN